MKFDFKSLFKFNRNAVIALLLIIFICTLEIISYYNSSRYLSSSISNSFKNKASDNANLLSQVFREKLTALKLIAENEEIMSMDWKRQKNALEKHINTLEVKRLKISDKSGLTKSTDDYNLNFSDREYFKKAISGISYISDVMKSRIDGSLVIVYAVPIKADNGEVMGVLSYTIDYELLARMINNIYIGENGYAFLVNKEGAIITHPYKEKNLTHNYTEYFAEGRTDIESLKEIQRKMLSGETGVGHYKDNGIKKFTAYSPINGTEWFLGITILENEIFSEIESLRINIIRDTFLLCLVCIIISYLLNIYLSEKKKVERLKKNAEESSRNLAEISELDKLKTEFFANLTHELRTPINVIYGALQLFEHTLKDKNQQNIDDSIKRIKTMKQNCFRMLRLVNNLIDATRIDANYFEINLENGDIIQSVENITMSVADYVKDKGIDLIFDTEIEEKIIAYDHDKIERIILNLLSNATKFTNAGGSIYVNLYDRADKIVISVKDTGVGIPNDKQQIIFERFRQVNKSFTRSKEGSGIGLSIVRSLVEMHDGKISVKSEMGKGSEFIIELPVRVLPEDNKNKNLNSNLDSNTQKEKVNIEFSDIYF